ncbi:DUF1093 domain-containing protein [Lacticaseibacillus yichunensis]|uniref:DUF1093 domain-containing protein n=1 Tax=Lacticaseibacillus yichunensis TaxID=2486015 RepID=A0ABW4CM82_9LACO|nr:DUF1093 domain-containing protein [Lacticaseibacillus yichunensis]
MKKIAGLIAVILIAALGFVGYRYWDTTYHSHDAYAVVTEGVKEKSKTAKGTDYKVNGKQYYMIKYTFDFYDASGNKTTLSYDGPESADPTPLTPGTYVRAKISQKRVTNGPWTISEGDVPAKALSAIKNQ